MSDKTVALAAQCPGCLGNSTKLHVIKNSYPIHRCSDCELLFVHPQPSKEELGKLYSASYFHAGTSMLPRGIRSMIQTGSMTSAKSSWSSDGVLVERC